MEGSIIEFRSIEDSQPYEFIPGDYQIELYGAQGGRGVEDGAIGKQGGLGAKVSIILRFLKKTKLYFYVGSQGKDASHYPNTIAKGGWNGGGDGGCDVRDNDASGAGGGSTDLRIIDSTSQEGIRSRIAVAAAGSGSSYASYGAPGGDLYIYEMKLIENENGYKKIEEKPQLTKFPLFQGQNGRSSELTPSSGAGGGYYGGITGEGGYVVDTPYVGTGGSSYVAGCDGEDEMVREMKKLGIHLQSWSATPGFPSIGRKGDGLATVLCLKILTRTESNSNYLDFYKFPFYINLISIF